MFEVLRERKDFFTSRNVLLFLVIATLLFNFVDCGLSYYFIIHLGATIELNPFMALLMKLGVPYFLFYKITIVPLLLYVLYRNRVNIIAFTFIYFCFASFAILTGYWMLFFLKI